MAKIRLSHVRTVVYTYLVWTPLNLFVAYACWAAAHPSVRVPARRTLYDWGVLHIAPLWALWDGTATFDTWIVVALAGLAVVAGLLIDRGWVRFLIVLGMSLWFLEAWSLWGIGV